MKFDIDDQRWPGIVQLFEETGELRQVISQLFSTNGEPEYWDGSNLVERLQNEMAYMKAAMIFVAKHCALNCTLMDVRATHALARLEEWRDLRLANQDLAENIS